MRFGVSRFRRGFRLGPAFALSCAAAVAADLAPSSPSADAKPARKPVPLESLPAPARVEISIPYPNAGMYLHRGIYGSFAGGRHDTQYEDSLTSRVRWQDPLFQWEGELGYFYTPWFSSGVGFRIVAGTPGDEQQLVKNRYFLYGRLHKAWPRAAAFMGLRVGVDDVSFSLLSDDSTGVGGRLSESNLSLGTAYGAGWKFSRYAGLTFGQRMDVSLVRQNPESSHRALSLLTQPGAALDLVRVFPSLGENVKAFYLLSELQFGHIFPEQGESTRYQAWIFGISMGF